MRRTVLLLALSVLSAGCVSNMGGLKQALGFEEPPPPEAPAEPPVAKAQANATSVLQGVAVRFTSEGTRDPQSRPLLYRWSFGDDASAVGPDATHAFAAPGEFRVVLNVTNDRGLGDEATLVVQVRPADRPPLASLRVLGPRGAPVDAAEAGEVLSFDASGSSDPEGAPLSYDWDFGDGATSHEASPTRSYAQPGLYVVRLSVSDGRHVSGASRLVAVNGTLSYEGTLDVTTPAASHQAPVPEGLARLRATLAFPGGLGGNDAALVLRDATGEVVARSSGETPPGSAGEETREVELVGEALRAVRGPVSAEVSLLKGVQVEYRLVVRETY